MKTVILCIIFIVLALFVLRLIKRAGYDDESQFYYGSDSDESTEFEENVSESIDYSQAYQPKWLFTYNEKAFYHELKAFADQHELFLFAKVRLLDLVEPRRGQKKYRTYFYRPAMYLSSRNFAWDIRYIGFVVPHDSINDGDHLSAGMAHGRHVGLPFIPFFLEIKLQRRIVKYCG